MAKRATTKGKGGGHGRKRAPAAAAEETQSAGPKASVSQGVVGLIATKDLETLMGQVLGYQEKVATASGNMGDLVRDYATNKNLHRGAFSDLKKLYRMGKKDPGKLWLHLAHFDDMRAKLKLDALAGVQGQLVGAGTDGDGDDEDDGDGVATQASPDGQVSRPKFGSDHPNYQGAGDPVKDIADKAGAQTSGAKPH